MERILRRLRAPRGAPRVVLLLVWLAVLALAMLVSRTVPAVAAVLPWIVAATCMSVVVLTRPRATAQPTLGELDRFLERCRRRSEPATMLFVDMPADADALQSLLRSARITDSLVVRRTSTRCEVYGLLDGSDVPRALVESRFAEALKGVTPEFGWASYPDDGLTLDVLLESARTSAVSKPAQSDGLHRVAAWAGRTRERSIDLNAERA